MAFFNRFSCRPLVLALAMMAVTLGCCFAQSGSGSATVDATATGGGLQCVLVTLPGQIPIPFLASISSTADLTKLTGGVTAVPFSGGPLSTVTTVVGAILSIVFGGEACGPLNFPTTIVPTGILSAGGSLNQELFKSFLTGLQLSQIKSLLSGLDVLAVLGVQASLLTQVITIVLTVLFTLALTGGAAGGLSAVTSLAGITTLLPFISSLCGIVGVVGVSAIVSIVLSVVGGIGGIAITAVVSLVVSVVAQLTGCSVSVGATGALTGGLSGLTNLAPIGGLGAVLGL